MPDINITVAHKVAVSDTQSIVCDNSDYTVHWTLDEDWNGYDTKTMRTIYMDGTFEDKVFSGDTIELPVCTVPGAVQIGLFAGNIRTSRVAILRALPSVRSAAGAPADPTPHVYDQLMEIIKGLGGVDPEAIKTAVAEYLTEHPVEETDPTVPEWAKAEITGAAVGQIAKIAAVDTDGVPTAWSPVDMPSGGGETNDWMLLADITLTEDSAIIKVDKTPSGGSFSIRELAFFGGIKCDTINKTLTLSMNGKIGYGNPDIVLGQVLNAAETGIESVAVYVNVLPECVFSRTQHNPYNTYTGYSTPAFSATHLRNNSLSAYQGIGDPLTVFAIAPWANGKSGVFKAGTSLKFYGR